MVENICIVAERADVARMDAILLWQQHNPHLHWLGAIWNEWRSARSTGACEDDIKLERARFISRTQTTEQFICTKSILLLAQLLLYIAETVQPKYRGMLSASGTATCMAGVCLQFIIGSVLHWRYVAAVSAIIPFIACNAVFLIPESPVWLCARNRIDEAHESLQWLRGWVTFKAVEPEFRTIVDAVEDARTRHEAHQLEQTGFALRIAPYMQRSFLVPFALIMFSFGSGHFSGMTPLQTYAFQILQSYRLPVNEYYATIVLGAIEVLGCVLGVLLIRSLGKRRITFLSMIGCGVCFFAAATYSFVHMKPVRQFDNMSELKPLDDLEHGVIDALATLRNDIATQHGRHQIAGDNVTFTADDNGLPRHIRIGVYTVDARNFRHIDSAVLYGILNLGLQVCTNANATDIDQTKLNEYLIRSGLMPQTTQASSHLYGGAMTSDFGKDSIRKRELLHVIEYTVLSPMVYAHRNETPTNQRLDKIKRAIAVDSQTNCEQNVMCSENQIRAISAALSEFVQLFNVDKRAWLIWMPMILLLGGSFFAHAGAKLLPWLLIGEVSAGIINFCVNYQFTCMTFPFVIYILFSSVRLAYRLQGISNGLSVDGSRCIERNFLFNRILVE